MGTGLHLVVCKCDGNGHDPRVRCETCHGGGLLSQGDPHDPDTKWVTCDVCHGFGVDKFERLRVKCGAITRGDAAKRSGMPDEARRQFAVAARLEHEIVGDLAKAGRDPTINAASEASCWLEAGEHARAREAAINGLKLGGAGDQGLGQEMALEFERVLDACERVLGPCPTREIESRPE